ncbi:helix-turn-helix transcriptional regulator [Chryseosolibacter indicus]|uniref:Response regulator transcription factor n=1 Tax=Chryseosolibacter indicus TaxID=2782351 RepID=A0ABS5VTY8_9BACT|nr:response regulator transcription factor [Chryseosolibacter indicus]MBT1704528.1 response regulator transcription factor [Chryseosolibacter indicus]
MKKSRKRILIIDKNQILKDAFVKEMASEDYNVVGFYKDVKAAFLSLLKSRPEIIVVVVDSNDELVVRTIGKIKSQFPAIKLLVQCDLDYDDLIFDLLTIGLAGLSNISRTWESMEQILHDVDRGVYPITPAVTRKIFESFQLNKFAELSTRQNEILRLMIMGATYSTIADKLGISRETAKTHMKNLYRKLQVHSKEEALAKAVEDKLILVI